MRIVLTVENSTMQFTLTPENGREKKLISILEGYSGEAEVRSESDGSSYYSSNFKRLVVTISPESKDKPNN